MSLSKFIFHSVFSRREALVTPLIDLDKVYAQVDAEKNKTGIKFDEVAEDAKLLVLKQLAVIDLIRLERVNRKWFVMANLSIKAVTKLDQRFIGLMTLGRPYNLEKVLVRFRDVVQIYLNYVQFGSLIERIPDYSSRIPEAMARRMTKIEKIGFAHQKDIELVLDYVRHLSVPSKLKHLDLAFEERLTSSSVVKNFVRKFRQLLDLTPDIERVALILSDDVAESIQMGKFVGKELLPKLKWFQFLSDGPIITISHYLSGVNYTLRKLDIGAQFCGPSVVQKYVTFAPNIESLSVSTNIESFKTISQLKSLQKIKLCLEANGESSRYTKSLRKKIVVEFLKVRETKSRNSRL